MGNKLLFTDDDISLMVEKYDNGLTFRQIGNIFKCSGQTIKRNIHSLVESKCVRDTTSYPIENGLKICSKCGVNKKPEEFYLKADSGKYTADCRECRSLAVKIYQQINADIIREKRHAANMTPEGKQKQWERDLRRNHGITLKDEELLLTQQDWKCASCADFLSEIRKHRHIDHNHETGKIRGILCSHCNLMIGQAYDDPKRLRLAANYLEETCG